MSKSIIEVNSLSKSYKISHQLQRNAHPTLKDDLNTLMRKPLSWIGASGGVSKELIWALREVSFNVERGDVVGIMGRNGSGKSTLFKILSRITHPTDGQAILRGTTASLLEVGTGFHPELTGRENVYFNGAVLGMKKKEIDEKFDQIVAFSEVEKFLDTPVKFYSSGMKVRLAFSVAAFLNPDILIIDEVLAVGDVRFKKKSLDHMKKIADEDGKTILFVSHIVSKVQHICTRGVVLDQGELILDGPLDTAIEKYLELNDEDEDLGEDGPSVSIRNDIVGDEIAHQKLKLEVDESGEFPKLIVTFRLNNLKGQKYDNMRLIVMIVDQMGRNIAMVPSSRGGQLLNFKETETHKDVRIEIPNLNLVPDMYSINLTLRDHDKEKFYFRSFAAKKFTVHGYEAFGKKFTRSGGGEPPVALDFDLKY